MADPVFLITGASSGIGAATSLTLARRGARLVLAARSKQGLADIGDECRQLGASTLEILSQAAHCDTDDFTDRLADVPGEMRVVLGRALLLEPHLRCTAAEFALALRVQDRSKIGPAPGKKNDDAFHRDQAVPLLRGDSSGDTRARGTAGGRTGTVREESRDRRGRRGRPDVALGRARGNEFGYKQRSFAGHK